MELKIKLKIKDIEIELDKKDLKELKNILDELFQKEKEYIYYPITYPTIPYYTKPYYRKYPYWEVTYTTNPHLTSGGFNSCGSITYTGSSTV
jgi:hypothetical protein